jgi:hypothetical protein
VGKYTASPTAKRAGLEGPLGSAIDRRHVYVYGTAGSPSREEVQSRRDAANRAAAWGLGSTTSGRLMLGMRAIPDTQVRPSDLQTSDLILFGTKETNSVIAKFVDQLPLHLSSGSEGYGLVYVYPVNGRYFLVGSGTPWFPLTDGVPQPGGGRGAPGTAGFVRPDISLGIDFFAPAQRSLTKWGDFVLYKDSPANIVAQGHFDSNWKLSAADAEKLAASGVMVSASVR